MAYRHRDAEHFRRPKESGVLWCEDCESYPRIMPGLHPWCDVCWMVRSKIHAEKQGNHKTAKEYQKLVDEKLAFRKKEIRRRFTTRDES